MPCFCAGIRRVNADVDDLGDFEAPIAYYLESFAVPCGIGNDIDSHGYVERASKLQCFEILGERHAFAVTLESLFIDRFETKEHGSQAEPLPELEDFLVSQQHVPARLKVITFPDPAARNRFAKLHAVLGLNERDVVHDKNSRLADLRQLINCALRCFHPVIASVERPRAAKNAVPRATPTELDGSSRVELADEIFPAMSQELACGQ